MSLARCPPGCRGVQGEGGSAHCSLPLLSLGHRAPGLTQTCSPLPNLSLMSQPRKEAKGNDGRMTAPQGRLVTGLPFLHLKWPSKAPTCDQLPARPWAENHESEEPNHWLFVGLILRSSNPGEQEMKAWHHPEVYPANPTTQEQGKLVSPDAGTVAPPYPHCLPPPC